MIRRSFRIGLTLGILAGLAVALTKLLRGSPGAEAHPDRTPTATPAPAPPRPWPALTTDPAVPKAPSTALHPDPGAPVPPVPPAEPAPATDPAEPRSTQQAPAKKPLAKKAAAKKAKPAAAWVEPMGSACPTSHPVKGKLASKIFHLPGMLNYDRTNPDRCYRDATAAEGDGLRQAKR